MAVAPESAWGAKQNKSQLVQFTVKCLLTKYIIAFPVISLKEWNWIRVKMKWLKSFYEENYEINLMRLNLS